MVAAQAKALQRNRILAIARAVHLVSGGYGTAIAALLDTTPCSAQKAYHRFASHSLILIVKVPPQLRSPPVGSDNRVTGMMVTVRVANFGQYATVPKAKLLFARRRRRKLWPERPFSLILSDF